MEYSKNFYQIKSNSQIFDMLVEEREKIGHFRLPYQETGTIKNHSSSVKNKYIVVLGIGGSSLGTRAIYDFLATSKSYEKELLFLETIDPLELNHILASIDLTDSHFVVVSKSGQTIETLSIFKYLNTLIDIDSSNCTIISGSNSNLSKFAKENKIKFFVIDENISGRFSVFSVVGLVPLAMIGVDIDNLLNGCKRVMSSFFSRKDYYSPIIRKARFLVENKNRFNVNAIFSYSSSLESFNKWYTQLWAESLGKVNINGTRQALTPVTLIGPVDQHSFLQLIIDGVRDKTVTFIKIDDLKDESTIPYLLDKKFIELGLKYVEGFSFNELLNLQADATIESIEAQKDIPCDTITIRNVDEYNIAKLMITYQLLVSCIGNFLQIDTYSQPGVEFGKTILKDRLNKINE